MQQVEKRSSRHPVRVLRDPRPTGPALRERRRLANGEKLERMNELLCECAQRGCEARLPPSAARHRGNGVGERFLVTPSHMGVDMVVAAADRFFVIELNRGAGGL